MLQHPIGNHSSYSKQTKCKPQCFQGGELTSGQNLGLALTVIGYHGDICFPVLSRSLDFPKISSLLFSWEMSLFLKDRQQSSRYDVQFMGYLKNY